MPNFRLEIIIEKVSKSDMDYIISQLEDAVYLCNGKVKAEKFLEYIELVRREENEE